MTKYRNASLSCSPRSLASIRSCAAGDLNASLPMAAPSAPCFPVLRHGQDDGCHAHRKKGLSSSRRPLPRQLQVGRRDRKNLGRAFDRSQALAGHIAFDEGWTRSSRSAPRSSRQTIDTPTQRSTTCFQRLEAYDGGGVARRTNAQSTIDDAFKRRLRFRVEFPMPDAEECLFCGARCRHPGHRST